MMSLEWQAAQHWMGGEKPPKYWAKGASGLVKNAVPISKLGLPIWLWLGILKISKLRNPRSKKVYAKLGTNITLLFVNSIHEEKKYTMYMLSEAGYDRHW
jgi:hypothetical protein